MSRAVALPTITDDSALGGAVIERSLRFNRGDSDHLTYTPSSASSDRTKITISAWVKKCDFNEGEYSIFHGGTSSTNRAQLRFYTSSGFDNISFFARTSGTFILQLDTTAKFRDTTGWYHIVARCDTTNGTANIYVNGEELTDFTTSTKPSGSQAMEFFNNSEHQIGERGYDGSGTYFDGYMTEINVIQGQALDASYFGYTEFQTGIWRPKRYTGSYGDGFYLNFSTLGETATTMGRDYSGNGNNFTPQNLEISDFSLDTPTNNFCTINDQNHNDNNLLTHGNLYTDANSGAWRPVSSTMAMSSGRWYWEVYVDTIGSYQMHGIRPTVRDDGDVNHVNDYYPGTRSDEWGYANNGALHNSASPTNSWGNTYAAGDILGFALDMDAGTLNIYKNGSSTGSQITGISAVHSPSGSRGSYQACFCPYGSNSEAIVNFGQDGTFAGHKSSQNNKDINGIGNFYYSVPTGFKAICAANFRGTSSYIINPKKHFDVVTWTGNNTAGRLIPLGFKPDFVWVKCRTAGHDHQLTDSVRGSSKALRANAQSSEEDWDVLYSGNNKGMGDYVDGGFILDDNGNNARYNNTGQTYVAWCWKGGGNSNTFNIDGTGYGTASAAGLDGGTINPTGASVNTKAKFSVLTYTGNGSDGATIEHGLGSIPVFVIVKKRTGDNWMVYHQANNNFSSPENYYLELNENGGDINADTLFNNTAPTSSVFSLDDDSSVNSNSGSFVAYCWGEVPGYSKFGMFGGTGVSGTNGAYIHTGFRPSFVIIKKFSGSDAWEMVDTARSTYNNKTASLYPSSETTETTSGRVIDFYSDGFKQQNGNGNTNEDGHQYVYFAWAEQVGETPYGTFTNAR